MICEICGKEYINICRRCLRRIQTWGIDGTDALYKLSKSNQDIITAKELLSFVFSYYQGKLISKREAVGILKIGLRLLGYNGKFERIHLYDDYYHIRIRQHSQGYRWRLRKDQCELCFSKEGIKLHHIIPISWGGITSDDNCITLCEKCHRKVHKEISKYLNRGKLLEYLKPYAEEIKNLAVLSLSNI